MDNHKIPAQKLVEALPTSGEITLQKVFELVFSIVYQPEVAKSLSSIMFFPPTNGERPKEQMKPQKIAIKPEASTSSSAPLTSTRSPTPLPASRAERDQLIKAELIAIIKRQANPISISNIVSSLGPNQPWTINQIRRAIREIKEDGTILQVGEKRGATYIASIADERYLA
jgi:hypothetical protein